MATLYLPRTYTAILTSIFIFPIITNLFYVYTTAHSETSHMTTNALMHHMVQASHTHFGCLL